MITAALVCLMLLRNGASIEVKEEVKENTNQTVNVSNLDTKPWVPLSTEDHLLRTPFVSNEENANNRKLSSRQPNPDHEAYIQQEISRMLEKLRSQSKNKDGAIGLSHPRSREGQHDHHQEDLATRYGQGTGEILPHEALVKFEYGHQTHGHGVGSEESGENNQYHTYLQAYMPHPASVGVADQAENPYLSSGQSSSQQYNAYETEEDQRQYPHQSLGNSIHVPYKTTETLGEHEYVVGKGLASGDHLKINHNHYKPQIAEDFGFHATALLQSLNQKPLKFERDVKTTKFAEAGYSDWSHLPPIPLKSSPHPYQFQAPLELHNEHPLGLNAPPMIKPHHSQRSQTMGLLKKALNVLAAFIPLGLFLAALTPNVITINSTNSDTQNRQRSTDGAGIDELASYPIFGLIEEFGYESLDDPDCENKIFCEVSRLGSQPSGNVIQKGFWQLAHDTPDDMAESLGLADVFKAVRNNSCDVYSCKNKYNDLASGNATEEATTENAAIDDKSTEDGTKVSEVHAGEAEEHVNGT